MNLLEILKLKKDSSIAQFESAPDKLAQIFTAIVDKAEMLNPTGVKTSASKAISIKWDGTKFIISVNTYNPPLLITWSSFEDIEKLSKVLAGLTKVGRKVGYMNVKKLEHGTSIFQLALA